MTARRLDPDPPPTVVCHRAPPRDQRGRRRRARAAPRGFASPLVHGSPAGAPRPPATLGPRLCVQRMCGAASPVPSAPGASARGESAPSRHDANAGGGEEHEQRRVAPTARSARSPRGACGSNGRRFMVAGAFGDGRACARKRERATRLLPDAGGGENHEQRRAGPTRTCTGVGRARRGRAGPAEPRSRRARCAGI